MFRFTILLALPAFIFASELDFIFNADTLEVNQNMTVHLDCGTRKDYRYCVWEHNNKVLQVQDIHDGLFEGMSKPNITDDNQCGIVLDSTDSTDHGLWTCTIFVKGSSLVGSKNISIMLKPSKPELSPEVIEATATEEFKSQCSVMDARPAADIAWFVGDKEITMDAKNQIKFSESKGTYSTISTLVHKFESEVHGQQLICQVNHSTLEEPMTTSVDINVLFAPVEQPLRTFFDIKQGNDYEIMLNFTANPAPNKVMWKYVETEGGMFSVDVPSNDTEMMAVLNGEDGQYSVVITMYNITNQDFEKDYFLHVENEVGMAEYRVMLSEQNKTMFSDPNPEEASQANGIIIPIVIVALLAVVITVAVVLFVHQKQMMCFAVRTESKAHFKDSQADDIEKGEANEIVKDSADDADNKKENEGAEENGQPIETEIN